jgi:competence protein ComEC
MLAFLPRTIGIGLGGFGILAFGILVGGGATVVRSCIMAMIALLASLLRKDYNVSKALFVAAAIMLIQNPLILFYDPSFQLSFLATLGLILLSSPIEKKLGFITEKFGIRGLVSSTLATQIFVSPYILYMMGQLSIIGIVVNILVLPIIPATMLLVSLTGLLGFLSHFVSEITGWISYIMLSYELFMVRFFASLPFASIELPKFSFWIVIGFYASYFVALLKLPSIFDQFRFRKKSST